MGEGAAPPPAEAGAPAKQKKAAPKRDYHVYKVAGDNLEFIQTVAASSDTYAIREVFKPDAFEEDTQFVAIAKSSFNVRTPKVKRVDPQISF